MEHNKPDNRFDREYIEPIICLSILAIFLTFTFIAISELLDQHRHNGWVTGDWLINYTPGFIRRGLAGETLIAFSDFFPLT